MNSLLYTDQAGFPLSTNFEGLTKDERMREFLELLEYPEIQEALNKQFEMFLQNLGLVAAVSKAHTRLDLIEKHLGADDEYCIVEDLEYGEREPRMKVPDQMVLLAASINNGCKITEVTYVSGNETEIRARLLWEKLSTVGYRNEKKFLDSKEVQHFLLHEVPEDHQTTEKASRKVANDVMKKAAEMFPEVLKLTKNSKGLNTIVFLEKRQRLHINHA